MDPDFVFDSDVLSIPLLDYMPESCTYDVPEECRSMKKPMKKSMKMKKSIKMSMKTMKKARKVQ